MISPLRGVNDQMTLAAAKHLAPHGVMAAQPPSSTRSEIIASLPFA
ncbi:MAG: hypothetical protein Q4G70_02395 [Pseudomonadota bacterium]|nr:hypothetical protein [Pseudomonadota bacterium]